MSSKPFLVMWGDLRSERRFESFDAAEKFARRLVKSGKGRPRDVEIFAPKPTCRLMTEHVATIADDALGRVWTELHEAAARLGVA